MRIIKSAASQLRKPSAERPWKKEPFFNGQPRKEYVDRAARIFEEFRNADAKRADNVEMVAERVAREGNMPHNTAYVLALRMVLLQRMRKPNP